MLQRPRGLCTLRQLYCGAAHSQDGWPVVDVAPEDVCLRGGLDEVSHIRAPAAGHAYTAISKLCNKVRL
jgi:hypothetical protein